MLVTATFPKGVGPLFRVAEGGGAAVRDLRVDGAGRELTGDSFSLPECNEAGCALSYTFAYRSFAMRERNLDMLRDKIYDAFIIKKENFPESYFELQQRSDPDC